MSEEGDVNNEEVHLADQDAMAPEHNEEEDEQELDGGGGGEEEQNEHNDEDEEELDIENFTGDFLDHEPTKQDKLEMKKASKPPSEWLRLLCKDWANENEAAVEAVDQKFLEYKPFCKGNLTSQLLVRLSAPGPKDTNAVDFWGILGIHDEFDKSYIVAQIERFSSLYSIRNTVEEVMMEISPAAVAAFLPPDLAAQADPVAVAAGLNANPNVSQLPNYSVDSAAAAAAAAAAASVAADVSKLSRRHVAEVSKAHRLAKDAEKALEQERRLNYKREQRRQSQERKEQKLREREAIAIRKAAERAARDAQREERRRRKLEIRMQREQFANEQKEAALQRAAELVSSNRVPIEITRGAAAAKAAATAAIASAAPVVSQPEQSPNKKRRSAIVVSTARDLHQIVTHSKNLWAKYNAIAKEHNQRVNWITVAKELGIHVKVREKYARMHSRAEQRGFDWEAHGDWKIKDHPEIFMEPTQAEQKAKMPPPPPDTARTVLIEDNKEVNNSGSTTMEDAADDDDAAIRAAALVDAAGVSSVDMQPTPEQQQTAAAIAASLVVDPTAGIAKADALA